MSLRLPRVCHAGLSGRDVYAYERTFHQLGIRHRDASHLFGVHAVHNTMHFQRQHHLHVDGVIGRATFSELVKHFDGYSKLLVRKEIAQLAVTPRDLVCGAAIAMYHHRPFPYEEVRPYPGSLDAVYVRGSDCSGTAEVAYRYAYGHFGGAKVPDPSGLHFDGYGYTGTDLNHGNRVWTPHHGDLAFFYPTYSHVGIVLDRNRTFSHGRPGDPTIIPTSWATMLRSYL